MHKAFRLVIPAALAALVASTGVVSAKTVSPAPTAAHSPKAATHKAQSKGNPTIKKIQTALNKDGAQLKVDGFAGPATRAAVKKYQAAHGLKATGRLDKATRAKLLA